MNIYLSFNLMERQGFSFNKYFLFEFLLGPSYINHTQKAFYVISSFGFFKVEKNVRAFAKDLSIESF